MRLTTFTSVPHRTERVSGVTQSKKNQKDQDIKRVRDVKQAEKRRKKQQKILRVHRKTWTMQEWGQLAKRLNSSQRNSMLAWPSFSEGPSFLKDEAQNFIRHSICKSKYLYPTPFQEELKKEEKQLFLNAPSENHENIIDSTVVQQLIAAREGRIIATLALHDICRATDKENNSHY